MNELTIVRVVFSERKPEWGGSEGYSYAKLRMDLGIEDSNERFLPDSYISNLLHDKPGVDDERFLRLVSGPGTSQRKARAAIEKSLGLAGLFSCSSREDVIDLIRRIDGGHDRPGRRILYGGAPEGDFGLTTAESNTIELLVDILQSRDQPVLHWDVPFNAGASIVAQNLLVSPRSASTYSKIAVLRPSDFEQPFEADFALLIDELASLGNDVTSKRKLADAIRNEGILVVILSAFALDSTSDTNSVRELFKEFWARRGQWEGHSHLLVVGESTWIARSARSEDKVLSNKLKETLRYSREQRFEEFQRQWSRFSSLREQTRSEESGSRMRRMATYYGVQNQAPVWPVSIKHRALFASNSGTAAYFDPTQGFRRLAGPRFDEFEDMKSSYEDLADYINYVQFQDASSQNGRREKRRYYYLLQYVSTAKHWLTEDALGVLIDRIDVTRPNPLQLQTEKKRLEDFDPVVTRRPGITGNERKARYFAGIALKAAVQDDWKKSDPYGRALAHYRVAKRLNDNQNDKGLLDQEFPYEPHWGRSRIFFVSETIRHLVRSTETFSAQRKSGDTYGTSFPPPPSRDEHGNNTGYVINYCYETLYQKELNGNSNGANGRALAKRYGAYQLAVELLELMSDGYQIGVPHPTLDPKKRLEFIRECGFALLDVGELDQANRCFETAEMELHGINHDADTITVMLDMSLVHSARGQLDEAEASIGRARQAIGQMHEAYLASDVNFSDYRLLRKLFRRVLAREAHLAFLRGNYARSLDLLDQIEKEARWQDSKVRDGYSRDVLVPSFSQRLEAEQSHLLIAALHGRASQSSSEADSADFAQALKRCVQAMLHAQSEGLHHEAMGFRIALARCFRRMKRFEVAETILDSVHDDLLRYGCSERTFLAFLNEAGRVLTELGDPVRAYATYLRPCIGRADARGFLREAEQAAVQARRTLLHIRDLFERSQEQHTGTAWTAVLERAVEKHQNLTKRADAYFSGGPFEKDPLFAYAIADAEDVINELGTLESIDHHLQMLDGQIASLQERNRSAGQQIIGTSGPVTCH